jgi:hypothetical protein
LLALVAVAALVTRDAKSAHASEDAPVPGSWRKLAVRKFDVPKDADMDAALRNIPRLLRHFKPAGVKVSDLSVENEGPRHLPRVTFKAMMHVDIEVGPVHVARDEEVWVRADVTARSGRCAYDPSRLGYEVKLDFTSSDEPLSANVSSMVAAFCVDGEHDGRHAELTTFMQVGPDYGTRVAGRLATNMLIKQTDPIVSALRDSIQAPATPDERQAAR